MSVNGINKIAVIGTGAIGGYYGAKLSESGLDVHFLARSDVDHIKNNGLVIKSDKSNDINLSNVAVYGSSLDMPVCDLVLIALKTTANEELKRLLEPMLGPNTILCSLQNGYGLEAQLNNLFPNQPIIGGLCFICSQKSGPGEIHHQDFGGIRFADFNAGSNHFKQTMQVFTDADIPVQISESLDKARWEKLIWNIPFNGLSVILNANTKDMLSDKSSRQLIKDIMLEVIEAANAFDCDIELDYADSLINLTDGMTAYFPSMKGDYDASRSMELDAIYNAPLKAAASKDIPMPKIKMLFEQLSFLNH